MQSFSIVKKSIPSESFRVAAIKGKFDLQTDEIVERFNGVLDIDDKPWQIGVIYGASGTGKSTIAKELFNKVNETKQFNAPSIIDDMPAEKSIDEITSVFNSVGFSTCWSWLKPYSVLSTGEKMRVDIADEILSDKKRIIIDEYTSVVNREVAKTASYAISKAIRKTDKQFIAISCHDDIIDWLEPDWVFYTDGMKQSWRCLQRPKIKIDIREVGIEYWDIFRKYHYLNHEIHRAVKCHVAFFENRPIAFCATLHFPHAVNKKIKRCSRLVVLPDFQGCGIGIRLLDRIAERYIKQGYDYRIVTSQSFLSKALIKHGWLLKQKSRHTQNPGKSVDLNRIMCSLKYIGNSEKAKQ